MSGETLNPTAPPRIAPRASRLPKNLLYSIFARIGGWGLDTDAFETLLASYRGGVSGQSDGLRQSAKGNSGVENPILALASGAAAFFVRPTLLLWREEKLP